MDVEVKPDEHSQAGGALGSIASEGGGSTSHDIVEEQVDIVGCDVMAAYGAICTLNTRQYKIRKPKRNIDRVLTCQPTWISGRNG